MIKPQELKIDNWITDDNGFPMQVVGVFADTIYADFEGNQGDVWEFDLVNSFPKPIKLREDVLLKCGFVRSKKHDNFYLIEINDWVNIFVAFHNKECVVELSVSNHGYCPEVKYLHQLQNLIMSLTGQELNVKL